MHWAMNIAKAGGNPVIRPRVAHLTSVHDPLDIRIYVRECRTLVEAGYSVTIIGKGSSRDANGVSVIGVEQPRSRLRRMTHVGAAIYRHARMLRACVYHIHDPELVPVGLLLRLHGRRVIYDAHEELPLDVMNKKWIPRALRRPVSWAATLLEKVIGLTFSAVVAATPTIAKRFPSSRTVTLRNFPLLHELEGCEPGRAREAEPPLFIHVGRVTAECGYREMTTAIRIARSGARLAFAGRDGDAEFLSELQAGQAGERVDWLGWLDRKEVSDLMAQAACGLVLSHPLPNYTESYPNKLFEYMSAGLPVIASNFPAWQRLIGDIGCAILVNPRDSEEVAAAITWIVDHPAEARAMGARGRAAVVDRFNWEAESGMLLDLYGRVCRRSVPGVT